MSLLTGEEHAELHEVLESAFPNQESLDVLVDQLDRLPGNIPGDTITARVFNLIRAAEAQGFLPKLLMVAVQQPDQQDNIKLQAVVKKLLERIGTRLPVYHLLAANPHQSCFLHAGRVLINRSELRSELVDLCSDQGSRVLVVNGDPVSGKSYSMQYIAFLADKFGHDRAYIDIKHEIYTTFGPDTLARRIGWQLRFSVAEVQSIPTRQAQDARWATEIGDWIIGASKWDGTPRWIVLDGFDHPDLPPETQHLIEYLMWQIETVKPPLRLVLLGYRKAIPRDIRRYVRSEEITRIDRAELAEFFEQLYGLSNKVVTTEEIAQIVDWVLARVPADDPERLYYLAEAVEETVKILFPRED